MSDKMSAMVVGIYNSGIQKRNMTPQESFENLVNSFFNRGIPAKDLQASLGRNSRELLDFDKSMIGQVNSLYQALEKKPLTPEQITEIKTILSVLYLRNLQQKEWEENDNYVSYDRLELGAEDYSQSNIPQLLIAYFIDYKDTDYTDYLDEIKQMLSELVNTNPTTEELKIGIREMGFKETHIESPGRLTNVPVKQQSFAGNMPLARGGVIRFAPTPNGPLHLGHGRGIAILSDYAERYNMEFILRFDDTDNSKKGSNLPPELKIPNVYDHIIKDFTWVRGKAPDKIIYASDRRNLDMYKNNGKDLVKKGLAYVYFKTEEGYTYGKSVEENISMYDTLVKAGSNPPFQDAGVLLGVPSDKKTLLRVYNMDDENMLSFVKNWVQEQVYGGKLKDTNIFGYSNTETGTKIMRYQKEQNIRVKRRGEVQWLWPTLNLQSVVDDKQEGVTHVIRGKDYNYQEAERRKDETVLRTIRMQTILRVLLKAPPIASTENWGNVSWDGGYTLSTSKLRKMIMEGKLGDRGFLHPDLPTIYALRKDSNNWGASFKFYWTRFYLPNDIDPTFKVKEFEQLNKELKDAFNQETSLINKNFELTRQISSLQERGLYLAEEN